MAKKKISFDIDVEQFEKIKLIIKDNSIGQGEFLRQIVEDAINEFDSSNYITIYIPLNNEITKFTIDKNKYLISISNASNTMIEYTGARKEGVIELHPKIMYNKNDKLFEIIKRYEHGVSFYTK